ncbi:MAG: type II toxin-antitoxin system VapC family toxin [bacterium]
MIWIIDASVAIRWFLENENSQDADTILYRVIEMPEVFAVPELFCFEVYAVLCRVHPSGHNTFIKGMIPILNGGIFRQPMTEDLAKNASVYVKKGLTGYDATYASLAKSMKGVWITFDQKACRCIQDEDISHDLTKGLPKNWESE